METCACGWCDCLSKRGGDLQECRTLCPLCEKWRTVMLYKSEAYQNMTTNKHIRCWRHGLRCWICNKTYPESLKKYLYINGNLLFSMCSTCSARYHGGFNTVMMAANRLGICIPKEIKQMIFSYIAFTI